MLRAIWKEYTERVAATPTLSIQRRRSCAPASASLSPRLPPKTVVASRRAGQGATAAGLDPAAVVGSVLAFGFYSLAGQKSLGMRTIAVVQDPTAYSPGRQAGR